MTPKETLNIITCNGMRELTDQICFEFTEQVLKDLLKEYKIGKFTFY
jgi:hypothetical protein